MKMNISFILKFLSVMLLLCFFAIPHQALAGKGKRHGGMDRLVIDFGDSHYRGYRGEPVILHLKKALRDQYPGLNIRDLRLNKVMFVGKTRGGRGMAQLRVGSDYTNFYRVAGHPRDFQYDTRHTFDRVRFYNPSYGSRGPWQLHLQGNFKVRKVVLVVEKKRRHREHWGTWSWPYGDYSSHPHGHGHSHYRGRSHDGRFDVNIRW